MDQAYVQLDIDYKYRPEQVTAIRTDLMPARLEPVRARPELYNIAADPQERNNLAATDPARLAHMVNALETWFEAAAAEGMRKRAR